ncbi:MAG: hypothetical protein ABIL58_09040 [Pseudomonadota bacterium]
MHGTFHGVLSLVLIGAAVAAAFVGIVTVSPAAGAVYILLVVVAVPIILFAYCAKCPVRLTGCRHGIPGPMTRYLPQRRDEPYVILDYIGLALPLALLVGAPQPFLWQSPPLLTVFWGLMIAGGLEIRRYVCTGCHNRFCPLRIQNKQNHS